jgi:uncharacterized coiled-coil DUF342 family protein
MRGSGKANIDETRNAVETLIRWMFKTSQIRSQELQDETLTNLRSEIPEKVKDLRNLHQAITDIANPSRNSMIQNIHKVFRNNHDALDEFQTHIAHLLPPPVKNNQKLEEYFRSRSK